MPDNTLIYSRTQALEQMRRGPFGQPLRLSDLPAPGVRWTPGRKTQLVAAVEGGVITLEEACRRYALSLEEFRSWQEAIEAHGVPGLRTTRTQIHRMTAGR